MIRLQDGTLLSENQYVIKEQFDGVNLLTFTLPENVSIQNEDVVFETIDRQEYLVKIINGDAITCELNLDGLKAQQTDFNNASATAGNTLTQALSGTGWTGTDNTGLTTKRTIKGALTPYDVIKQITETWDGVTPVYDNNAKTVTLVYPDKNEAKETFLTEDLNLRQLDIAGDSSNFCTRLRAKGKDGLTFADINNGKDYVEDYTYSSKVIYGQMIEDERFTSASSLKEYAAAKLAEMAVPTVSYECDVVDVAAYDSDYSFLKIKMHKAIWLLDKRRNTRIQHRVVAYERHPANPENNKVTLATVIKPLQNTVKSIEEMLNDPNSEFVQKIEIYVDTTAGNATSWLLGAKGGNVIFRKNDDGQPEAIIIADGLDINTAQNVWLWNVNGLGFSSTGINGTYETAITSDGNIVGKFVTAEGLHVNAANINGTLQASQINADNLHVKAANIDGTIQANQINANSLHVSAANIDGTIQASQINADNLTVSFANITGTIIADKVVAGCIETESIANDAVTNAKLGYSSVSTGVLQDTAVTQGKCSISVQNAIADAITAGEVFAGSAIATYVRATYLYGDTIYAGDDVGHTRLKLLSPSSASKVLGY